MADIQLRLGKDMLVLTTSAYHQLEQQGADAERDTSLTLLVEPEVIEDIYKLEALCGVQCAVAPTAQMTPARLAHTGLEAQEEVLVRQAMEVAAAGSFQHVLVEIGPCGLPLDASSKASLLENRDQYARAAKLFANFEFDAFFLNGFSRIADLKCALMGVAKVSDVPVIASVDVNAEGMLASFQRFGICVDETIEEAAHVAVDLGAMAFGFCTDAAGEDAAALADRIVRTTSLPVMAQLFVHNAGEGACAAPYEDADAIVEAAELLRASGVQFLRACGSAPAAYAGALVAATEALDVVTAPSSLKAAEEVEQDLDALADRLKRRVNESLGA